MCEVLRVGEECHLRPHYTLSPDLPPGLSLDPHTGCITGIPEAHAPRTKYTLTASFEFEVLQDTTPQPLPVPDQSSIQTSTPEPSAPASSPEPPVTPADPYDPSPSEGTTDAGSCPVPPWWHADPDEPTVAAVPLEEAIQGLVAEAVEEECGHRLTQAELDSLVCAFNATTDDLAEFNKALAKGNKPLRAVIPGCSESTPAALVEHVKRKAGGDLKVEVVKKGTQHFLLIQVGELAWSHELRRRAWAERVHTVHLDPLERANCEQLLRGLQQAMDGCALTGLRNMVEQAMLHLQKSCPVTPDHKNAQYREWVEEHFCGSNEQPCFWEKKWNEDETCARRLAFAEPHEYTTALFINFKNFVGRPISFMDWSALCACCESCDVFKMTVCEADQLGLCTPYLEGCDAKLKSSIPKMKLVQVARVLRDVRNPMQHYNILDMEFPAKFASVELAARALGGNVDLAIELTKSNQILLPAQNTLEEVRQHEHRMAEGTIRVVTGEQCAQLQWMRDQPLGCMHKMQAGPGTGKTLVASKHAECYLRAARYMCADVPPLLLLTHSRLLRAELAELLRQELGLDPEDGAPGEGDTHGACVIQLPGCSASVVVSAVDELWDLAMPKHFGNVVVDEAHHVFSYQPLSHIEGQHVHKDPRDVWTSLKKLCLPERTRFFFLHDESYQRVGEVVWPDGCEEHQEFLSVVVRMTGAGRDVAMPHSRNLQRLGTDGRVHYYKLLDERVKGPEPRLLNVQETSVKMVESESEYVNQILLRNKRLEGETLNFNRLYGKQLAECLQELLCSDGLAPGQVAVLMPGASERMVREMHEATLEHCVEEVAREALAGELCGRGTLYWGSVESFAGLERPAVVMTGFHHPLYLVHKHVDKQHKSKDKGESQNEGDPLVYLAATRSTYLLAVVDTKVEEFMSHYAIRKMKDELVPHSTGSHSASMEDEGCLMLEYKLDFSKPMPERLDRMAMISTVNLTPENWAKRKSEGFDWGICQSKLRKLETWFGQCAFDTGSMLRAMQLEVLKHLQTLRLDQNQLRSVPKELGNLKSLQVLRLDQNQLSSVPKELGNLEALQSLDLHQNQLSSVPKELGNLEALQHLHLDQNQLSSVPKELGNLKALQHLHLDQNQLSSVPKELGNLKALQTLNLHQNQLSSVPKELGNLKALQNLDLHQNQLSSVPKELGNLEALQHLYLDQNQLRSVPKELGNLKSLQVLRLDQNQLSSVPKELGNLEALQYLYLHKNQLSSVPKELGSLEALQRLDLSQNQLSSVPKELGNLEALQSLYLGENQLSSVPKELGSLEALQHLHLHQNQLSSVPKELGNLEALQNLNLHQNQLSSVPKELGNLEALQHLHLDQNQLSSVPKELGNLEALQNLHLSQNQLSSVPKELANLRNLAALHIGTDQKPLFRFVSSKLGSGVVQAESPAMLQMRDAFGGKAPSDGNMMSLMMQTMLGNQTGGDISQLAQMFGGPQSNSTRDKKVRPNDKCPCGSGQKYKKCCKP